MTRSALRGRALLWLPLIALALTPLFLMWLPLSVSHELEVGALLSALPQRCERVALYMGYPSCQTECPVALRTLASHERTRCERCCVLFVNLDERWGGEEGLDPAQRYLNGFNVSPTWRGVSPPREVMRALEAQLSTRSDQLKTSVGEPPHLSHSDLVWLLKRPPRSLQGGVEQGEVGAWRLIGFMSPARFSWLF